MRKTQSEILSRTMTTPGKIHNEIRLVISRKDGPIRKNPIRNCVTYDDHTQKTAYALGSGVPVKSQQLHSLKVL